MSNKCYAFPVPNLELKTLHTYARLVKKRFPEIYTDYVEDLTKTNLKTDIPSKPKRGNFLVASSIGNSLYWGWDPSKYFSGNPYEVISLDDYANREFLGDI